jgi:hypothetical protein
MTRKIKSWPVRKTMCLSCPFREGGDRQLAARVIERTIFKASQICHHPALSGKKEHELCRGARNEQLTILHRMRLITEPTDAAFRAKLVELGLEPADETKPD